MATQSITVEGSGHECNVTLSTWLQDILPRTPGVVRRIAKRELILTAREFFEQSGAWRVLVGPKDMKADKKRYVLSPYDAYADTVSVLGVEYLGDALRAYPRPPALVTRTAPTPIGYYLSSPDTVRLWPLPTSDVADALTFYVALMPKPTVTHLPKIAYTHFYDALLDGVLGRLYNHPAKPYSNPNLGAYHLRRFRTAIAEYAGRAKEGFTHAPSWSYPGFGK
jgi:hypothetical protein